jgi:hypothetical protein
LAYGTLTRCGTAFQPFRRRQDITVREMYLSRCRLATPCTQRVHAWTRTGFRQIPFRSPLLRDCFFFLGVHEMFQFPHLPPTCGGSSRSPWMGLPHSEMMGSRPDCGSSIVSLLVCVLRRLVVPRHPPTAHHVLPGHGVLGGRGVPCWGSPRRRTALQTGIPCCRPFKNDHN